jgi:membrane AbrB-like protein
MSAAPSPQKITWLRLLETLAIGCTGGMMFGLAGLPAGFLSGAMLFVATAALAGRPVGVPSWLARTIFIIVGISLGAVATPETLSGIAAWPLSIATLAVSMAFSTIVTMFYLRRVHGWDPMSAYLGSVPGLLTQVLVVAAQTRADMRGVVIVQIIRVVILAIGVPTGLALFGLAGTPPVHVVVDLQESVRELAILVIPSAIASFVFHALRFPAGWLFGAMIVSVILHAAGIVHVSLPWWLVAGAMCGLGCMSGSRFANTALRTLLSYLGAAVGSFVVGVLTAGIFVFGLVHFLSMRTAEVVVSFAPGGLDVMMILSLALHLDPVFVGAHHLSRFLLISVSMPFAIRMIRRRMPPLPGGR